MSPSQRFVTGKYSPQQFLKRYWQKAPLLVRGALWDFHSPLSPDELAGLACETEVESRLVLEKGGKRPWEVKHGPFTARDFKKLPKTHWTLLVQGVDRLVPDVALLLDRFDFIPNWRIEDVMISYAVRGGNVGAHVDNYDVFLIQVSGKREWQIGDRPVIRDEYRPGLDLRLLKKFTPAKKWVLGPGDMLYLPPRFAHHGIARTDDCMTYSVGFRAPEYRAIVNSLLAESAANYQKNERYADPDLRLQREPGEIQNAVVGKIRQIAEDAVADERQIADWFGRYVTRSRDEMRPPQSRRKLTAGKILSELKRGCEVRRHESARMAYFVQRDGAISLFCNGEHFSFEREFATAVALLTKQRRFSLKQLSPILRKRRSAELVRLLFEKGYLYFAD